MSNYPRLFTLYEKVHNEQMKNAGFSVLSLATGASGMLYFGSRQVYVQGYGLIRTFARGFTFNGGFISAFFIFFGFFYNYKQDYCEHEKNASYIKSCIGDAALDEQKIGFLEQQYSRIQ